MSAREVKEPMYRWLLQILPSLVQELPQPGIRSWIDGGPPASPSNVRNQDSGAHGCERLYFAGYGEGSRAAGIRTTDALRWWGHACGEGAFSGGRWYYGGGERQASAPRYYGGGYSYALGYCTSGYYDRGGTTCIPAATPIHIPNYGLPKNERNQSIGTITPGRGSRATGPSSSARS